MVGDTNFMPVITANTKVMVEGLQETWDSMKPQFDLINDRYGEFDFFSYMATFHLSLWSWRNSFFNRNVLIVKTRALIL